MNGISTEKRLLKGSQMNEQVLQHEDEIELMDILLVIWRWKVFIICVVALVTITASISVFFVPSVYKTSMVIKPVESNSNKAIVPLSEIRTIIDLNILNKAIIDKLKLSEKNLYKGELSFENSLIKGSDNMELIYYSYESDQGARILNELIDSINQYFQSDFDFYIEQHNEKILSINLQLSQYENKQKRALINKNEQINRIVSDLSYFEKNRSTIEREIELIEAQKKNIKQEKSNIKRRYDIETEKLSKFNPNQKLNLTGINYYNTVLFFELKLDRIQKLEYNLQKLLVENRNQLAANINNVQKLYVEKKRIQEKFFIDIDIEDTNLIINEIKNKRNLLQNNFYKNKFAIGVVISPVSSFSPVKPKKELIIILSLITSLFLSIFSAFIFEYFKNYNKRE